MEHEVKGDNSKNNTKSDNVKRIIHRGDVVYANLNPVMGSEQGGCRPVLVIQNDIGNKNSPTIIIAAMTSQLKSSLPTHVQLDADKYVFLPEYSIILLEQVRTIDKARVLRILGKIDSSDMKNVDRAVKISIGIA